MRARLMHPGEQHDSDDHQQDGADEGDGESLGLHRWSSNIDWITRERARNEAMPSTTT